VFSVVYFVVHAAFARIKLMMMTIVPELETVGEATLLYINTEVCANLSSLETSAIKLKL